MSTPCLHPASKGVWFLLNQLFSLSSLHSFQLPNPSLSLKHLRETQNVRCDFSGSPFMAHEIRVLRLLCNPAKVIGFENYVVLGPKSQIEIICLKVFWPLCTSQKSCMLYQYFILGSNYFFPSWSMINLFHKYLYRFFFLNKLTKYTHTHTHTLKH